MYKYTTKYFQMSLDNCFQNPHAKYNNYRKNRMIMVLRVTITLLIHVRICDKIKSLGCTLL